MGMVYLSASDTDKTGSSTAQPNVNQNGPAQTSDYVKESFDQFYSSKLKNFLNYLDRQRRSVATLFVTLGVVCIGGFIILFGVSRGMRAGNQIPMMIGGVITALSIGICWYRYNAYRRVFKDRVVKSLISYFDPGLRYEPKQHISLAEFNYCHISKREANRCSGEDFIAGKRGETRFTLSEIKASHETGSGKDKKQTILFCGLLFIADFNKKFCGRVVIYPDQAEKLLGSVGQGLQSLDTQSGQLIKLEDPEFEREFVVYGTDQVEARYILSLSLMDRIMKFRKKVGRQLSLSFIDSKLCIGIHGSKNYFEPRLFRPINTPVFIREIYQDLQFLIGMIDEMRLNERLWSKK